MNSFKQSSFILFSVLACCSGAGFRAFAWDNPGHMAVAGLAYDELSSAQQSKLIALLQHHPGLQLVTEGFPGGVPSDRDLVMAMATWPDLAKRSKDYQDNGYEATAPAVTTVSFDHKMHKGWHFIDTPLWVGSDPSPANLPDIPKVNAVGVVNVLKTQLQSGESDDAKAYDLGWLLHLVGDLHQPLHAVTGVTDTFPKGDTGGNAVSIHGTTHSESELHAYWDDILGKTAPSDKVTHLPRLDKDVVTAADIITSVKAISLGSSSNSLDPQVWADESYKMAKEDVYSLDLQVVSADRGDKLAATLDDTYSQTATIDAKQRIRMAGHRLALILESTLQ